MPREVFVAGQILTAAELNVVSDQSVMVFDDATARTSAIASPSEGMVTYLKDTNSIDKYSGSAWIPASNGFTASETITATNASWPVPALGSPIVKVTAIGGGGGGGGQAAGGNGGTTTFAAGGAGTVTAGGGNGQAAAGGNVTAPAPNNGLASANQAPINGFPNGSDTPTGAAGGKITVAYLNLSGISTVNVTIGAGGTAGGSPGGRAGGSGEVIVEYVAG